MAAPLSADLKSNFSSAKEQSGAEQVAALMDQMRSKDALVIQLTERLEAAAEQLDRIQRTGGDRRQPGSGGSRELVEQTGQLTSRVEEALESWGQTSSHYEVILQRLDEIADHLGQSGGNFEAKPASRAGSASPASSASHSSPAAAAPPQGSFWEKMKASMADGSSPPPTPASAFSSSSSPSASHAGSAAADDDQSLQPASLDHIAPPPVAIDVDAASIDELREAVSTRDAYISTLIAELRMAHTLPSLPNDLLNSELGPSELLASLIELETRLKIGVQRENLDLSLERARMGRERVRLDQVKAQLEGQIKRLAAPAGGKSEEGAGNAPAPEPAAAQGKLGWLKRLAPKKPTA